MGFIGMTPAEYDNILYRDLMLKLEGFKQKLDREEIIFRQVAYSAYIGPTVSHKDPTKKSIDKFWPIDAAMVNEKITPDRRARIREGLKAIKERKLNNHA